MLRFNRLRPLTSRIRFASSNSEIEDLTKSNKSFRSDVKQVHHFDTMLNYDDFFGVLDKVSWQDLAINRFLKKIKWIFKTNFRMQYGHHETVRDPYMAQYLLGTRCGVDIIDVDKVMA